MVDLIENNRDALIALCKRHHVKRLDVFGSAATGEGFDPQRSDVDLLVEFEAAGIDDPWTYFRLREALVQLLGREVDLIEPGGIRNRYYRQGIDATRRSLHAA